MTGTSPVPRRVLIADDRPRSRNGLRALLNTCTEIEVIGEAADGQETIRLVKRDRPNVVVMDAQMPTLDGLAATREIKARWPNVRVVMLTMYDMHRSAALSAGADAFLVKGCPPDELLEAILIIPGKLSEP